MSLSLLCAYLVNTNMHMPSKWFAPINGKKKFNKYFSETSITDTLERFNVFKKLFSYVISDYQNDVKKTFNAILKVFLKKITKKDQFFKNFLPLKCILPLPGFDSRDACILWFQDTYISSFFRFYCHLTIDKWWKVKFVKAHLWCTYLPSIWRTSLRKI